MKITTARRSSALTALALTAALALSACGGSSTPSSSSTGAASSGGSTSASASPQATSTTVETAFGQVSIPTAPKRVVALEGSVGPLLDAGITPLATADGDYEDSFLPDEFAVSKDLPVILTQDGWDYEKIAALKPDLLVGFVRAGKDKKISDESQAEYDKLSKIAPTVFILSEGSAQTKEATLKIAEILGSGESAEAAKAAYDKKAAQIKTDYADVLSKNVFAAVDYYEGTTTVYTPISWIGGILSDAGATIDPVAAQVTDSNGVDLSSEQLSKLNTATIILTEQTVGGEPGIGAAEIAEVPTFKELPAVKAGHSYGISHFFADRYETGLKVLEQLEEILKKQA